MKNVEKSKKRKRSDTLATRNIERTLPRKRGTRGGLEYFRFHRKTSCSLPSSPPSSPGLLFVCLGYSTRHPRVCHSSFVTDPFFSFFFFFPLFFLSFTHFPPSVRLFERFPPRLLDCTIGQEEIRTNGEARRVTVYRNCRGVSFLFLSHRRDLASNIS